MQTPNFEHLFLQISLPNFKIGNWHFSTFFSDLGSNSVCIIFKNCSEHGRFGQFSEFQNYNSNCPSLNFNLSTLMPFSMRKNGIYVKPERPSSNFGTFHPKLLHKMSFYLLPNSAVYHGFSDLAEISKSLLNHCFLETLELPNLPKKSFKLLKLSTIATYILCTNFFMFI